MPKKPTLDFDESYVKAVQADAHQWHTIYAKIMAEHEGHQLRIREYILKTYSALSTATGLVAGFGFTSIDTVHSLFLFILGEMFLIGALIYGVYFLKKFHIAESNIFFDIGNQWTDRFEMKSTLYKSFLMGDLTRRDYEKKMEEADAAVIASVPSSSTPHPPDLQNLFDDTILLVTIGSALLLFSFVNLRILL